MHLESALLFESLEQLYTRVFRIVSAREPLPTISVYFRRYTTITNRIRLADNRLTVELSDLLQRAPAPIQEALAYILITKLFRKTPDRRMVACYRKYLNQGHVRRMVQSTKQERGRKYVQNPKGSVYNLETIFKELNIQYFDGSLQPPRLGWSTRTSRTTFGHFDPSHYAIVLNRRMDTVDCPELAVRFILFHEMLHIFHPVEHHGARRCIHTEAFKLAEKQFEMYAEAKKTLRAFAATI